MLCMLKKFGLRFFILITIVAALCSICQPVRVCPTQWGPNELLPSEIYLFAPTTIVVQEIHNSEPVKIKLADYLKSLASRIFTFPTVEAAKEDTEDPNGLYGQWRFISDLGLYGDGYYIAYIYQFNPDGTWSWQQLQTTLDGEHSKPMPKGSSPDEGTDRINGTFTYDANTGKGIMYRTVTLPIYDPNDEGGEPIDYKEETWTDEFKYENGQFIFGVRYERIGVDTTTSEEEIKEESEDTITSEKEDGEDEETTTSEEIVAIEPEMKVRPEPAYFSVIGEKGTISIKLTGSDGLPLPGETVILSDGDTGSQLKTVTTDANGAASVTIEHNDPLRKIYTYRISAVSIVKDIVIPVLELGISLELNPISPTGESFRGLAADGISTLAIMIKLDGADGGVLKLITRPSLGELAGEQLSAGGTIALVNGEAIITYIPPAYLTFEQLTRHAEIYGDYDPMHGSHFTAGWAAVESLELSYTAADGKVTAYSLEIEVYRPPVMMVHGFTGDRTTWAEFAFDLREEKFITHTGEYYYLDQSIPSQAIKLKDNIEGQIANYKMDNIKVAKVDLVVHSMGGLISRYYISNNGYENNVRKLIMVGTPNHGCSWGDLQLGRLESWLGGKHQIAAEQLYGNSEFITTLNQGESMGLHLHKDIEYGNIYSYSAFPGFFSGDIVVPAASARLNGVRDYRVEGHAHSPAVSLMVLGSPPSITQSNQVFQKVVEWLTTKIERVPLAEVRTLLVKAEGEVYIKYIDQFVPGQDLPKTVVDPSALSSKALPIGTYDIIGTGPGSTAVLYLFTNDTRWGIVFLNENTELKLGFLSPKVSEVKLLQGSARFSSLKITDKGHYSVEIAAGDGRWQNVTGLETDFVVTSGSAPSVYSIDGSLIFAVETASGEIASKEMVTGESYAADQGGVMTALALPAQSWWESDFYKPTFAEQVTGLVDGFFGQLSALWALLHSGNWRNLSSADWKNFIPVIALVASAFIAVASTSIALAKRSKRHNKTINSAVPGWFVEVTNCQSSPQMTAITAQPVKVGREPSQTQLVIGDMKVSRVHAQLYLTPENYVVIEDMGSTWGTFVNEQQITGPVYLNNGDCFRMGDTILRLVWM
jgi:pimeloyl-ACP methyl ester carboxylesterase